LRKSISGTYTPWRQAVAARHQDFNNEHIAPPDRFGPLARRFLMHVIPRRHCLVLFGAAAAGPLLGSRVAHAQDTYPSKPITIIVPWPPGGPTDICARLTAEVMSRKLGQPIVVENRSGATGNIGAQAVAHAAPDGYTLLFTLDSTLTANVDMYGEQRMGYNPEKDLAPITTLVVTSQLLGVNPSTGIKTFKEFVEIARTKGLNYASAGIGSPGNLTMEALHSAIGGRLNHIPYRGNAPATNALLSGEVQAAFISTPGLVPHVKAGKVTALAVSGRKRSTLLPDLPTIAQQGYPQAAAEFDFMYLAPAGTPGPIIDELNRQMRSALTDPKVLERMQALDIEPLGDTPAQAAQHLKETRAFWKEVIKERGIKPD
jgi:tripartite-type tricarboxylate transporter receptor subunit TctC